MTAQFELYPLFNKPIANTNVPLDDIEQSILLEYLRTENWNTANQYDKIADNTMSKINKNIYVLEKKELFFLKKKIEKVFNEYKNKILRYENVNFRITTSWFTKTEYGQKSDFHKHSNCMFSAVFYINQPTNSATITFKIFEDKSFLITPVEWNIYNATGWTFNPKKHDLLIFPSETYHKIDKHLSNEERYSLALNFLPIGKIGESDSELCLI